MLTALFNTQIISNGVITKGKAVLINGTRITEVVDEDAIPQDAERRDLQGAYIASGLLDLQIYGAGGSLFGGIPTAEALHQMEKTLLQEGCTGFFATVATNSDEVVLRAIEAAKAYRPKAIGTFMGLHLEGPFLNPIRKGAHPAEYIKKATIAQLRHWIDHAQGEVKMVTIAPELQDAEVLNWLGEQDIVVSAGHSDATYEQALSFFDKSIHAATHLFNAMPPMHHRQPGLIPAIFEARPYTSIVADGIHVNFAMIALAKRLLGNKLFLITDAVTEASEGTYQHQLKGDRYVMPDGTLSGSALTMLKAVQNCVEHVGIELVEAINMATLYPAQLAGLANKGKVERGYDADLLIFDAGFNTKFTICQGKTYDHSQLA
ncbi:N-acetylglucosamine-6-phosphate deacetylase [Mucilaginibacter daejeonensis]|uniref:N-acetylglucosamine-6-phosphate deacetylase n=1 Tax=Mucilaginibacter daejeonensis TaxID=398049 RepID=UPI001D1744BC|nr:N-acetylglucosamine-6-phosphate deacetylase [Mucilaginibacter daejeonensis]UEG53641.1 N-acetylglucosamine-6-phosphate deacetylase [Mucilaginibacter daejeonensis]